MNDAFDVQVTIGKQEDGLWRAEVPGLQGCWVDAPTIEQAVSDIQEGAALMISVWLDEGWELPGSVAPAGLERLRASLPVKLSEHARKGVKQRAS